MAELQQAKGRGAGHASGREPLRPVLEHSIDVQRQEHPRLTDPIHLEAARKPVVDDLRTAPFRGKGAIERSLARDPGGRCGYRLLRCSKLSLGLNPISFGKSGYECSLRRHEK